MDAKTDKLKVNLEERIKAALKRFEQRQACRKRPLLRRKNNFVRGGMGIMGIVPPPPSKSLGRLAVRDPGDSHSQVIFPV